MKIQTKIFKIADLIDKTIHIKSFKDKNIELIVARDESTGNMYILQEIIHPIEEKSI